MFPFITKKKNLNMYCISINANNFDLYRNSE